MDFTVILHICIIIYIRLIIMKNKITSIIIVFIILLSFSFFGLAQLPNIADRSLSLVRTIIPYPGKTVLVINNFLKKYPDAKSASTQRKTSGSKNNKQKVAGMIMYMLSSVLVCNEKVFLLFLMVMAGLSINILNSFLRFYRGVFVPPDIQYYRLWRLKFLTPIDKCIKCLVDKYDINPIYMDKWALSARNKNRILFNFSRMRFFLFISEWSLVNSI